MDPSLLPDPAVLRRRHEALAAAEELVASDAGGDRYYGAEPPDRYWSDSGSGDFYALVIAGDDALLTVFDHESPRSPWGRADGAPEWPGMCACFWSTDGRWREGQPEPVVREGDVYDDYPGGAAGLLAQLLDPEAEVRELVGYVYEQPARIEEALALIRAMGVD